MFGNLGLLEGGAVVSYDVCLQDYFFNTAWSDKNSRLVASFEAFSIFWDEIEYHIITLSNSTIMDFNFTESLKQISFNVTGSPGTTGFCNVTIPSELLRGEFSVYQDDTLLVKGIDYTQKNNITHHVFHITYSYSTHTIKIRGTEVIPELSPFFILLLFMIMLPTVIIQRRKKLHGRLEASIT